MPKLRMPVRYGSEIKDIEFSNFLNLTDTVEQIIDCPVGVAAPAVDRGIASGKFLRSGDSGNLLACPAEVFENTESITIRLTTAQPSRLFAFAQRVNGCLIVPGDSHGVNMTMWVDPAGVNILRFLSTTGSVWIPFSGHELVLTADLQAGGYIDFTVFGLY